MAAHEPRWNTSKQFVGGLCYFAWQDLPCHMPVVQLGRGAPPKFKEKSPRNEVESAASAF